MYILDKKTLNKLLLQGGIEINPFGITLRVETGTWIKQKTKEQNIRARISSLK